MSIPMECIVLLSDDDQRVSLLLSSRLTSPIGTLSLSRLMFKASWSFTPSPLQYQRASGLCGVSVGEPVASDSGRISSHSSHSCTASPLCELCGGSGGLTL